MPTGRELPDDELVQSTILAIDAVGHSRLVRELSSKRSHALFDEVQRSVAQQVKDNDGIMLGWAGDGGIASFTAGNVKDDEGRAAQALRAAGRILAILPNLNREYGLEAHNALKLRLALHSGTMISRKVAASIHSQDINFVAHLEHALPEDVIGLSKPFYNALSEAEKNVALGWELSRAMTFTCMRRTMLAGDERKVVFGRSN